MQKSLYKGLYCFVSAWIFLAGCGNAPLVEQKAALVQTEVIKMSDKGQSAVYSGAVRGRYETQLSFQVDGKIIKRSVQLGSQVQAGDVLMEIDPKDINQLVNSNSAQVASAQSQLKLAESNLNRYRQLLEQDIISRAQYDQYQNAYDAAAAALQQASAQYSQGINKLNYTLLQASSSGVVSAINVEAGQVVSAGQPVLTLVQDGEREVEISVPENQVESLQKAAQLTITFWALNNTTVTGEVREISPMADPVSRTYKARIRLINPPSAVKLGMTAAVNVAQGVSGGNGSGVYIPLAALYQSGNQPNVWVVENGALTLRPISVGTFGDNQIQVLSGLQPGERIVTAGVHKLQAGQKVRTAGEE
ncbi:MAG: efflux RND transporter periplasmic adaptor subunit [Sporomusaceae bacterium]|nr:efflux RND transporter periplasmic adaptor subunit [Sporomusaceae bacterium]